MFIAACRERDNIVAYIQDQVIREIAEVYPEAAEESFLPMAMAKASESSGGKFIVIIDEWDALFREAKEDTGLQKEYIQLLRGLFKSSLTDSMIEAAYMTGILPIKKYGTQSAMTDFREYTMLSPKRLAKYVGFTEEEVKRLCGEYDMDFEEAKKWYDGYSFKNQPSVYNPNAIMQAMQNQEFFLAVKHSRHGEIARFIKESDELLQAVLNLDAKKVAAAIEKVHRTFTTPIFYNNEQALRSVIRLAFISSMEYFKEIQELPSGTGYADMVYMPKKNSVMPMMVVELKWNRAVEGAIRQIKERNYPEVFEGYGSEILLVGVSYDEKTKKHDCVIERWEQEKS